jgi:alpha-L-arabinofuranosidase
MTRHQTLFSLTLAIAALACLADTAAAQTKPGRMTVRADQPGPAISPMLYGLMTEEINHSYDGGLYAELIQNRNFKADPKNPVHWSLVQSSGAKGEIALDAADPVNTALGTSLRLDITAVQKGQRVGVANSGYWGIPVKPATTYRASFYAKAAAGFSGPLNVSIESNDGAVVCASGSVPAIDGQWKRYALTLTTGRLTPSARNRFVISAQTPGTIWLSLVSLFPPTFNNRPNGNRIDIMEKLGAMRPAFLRLPGGNYLEGDTIAEHFDWKKTIGDIAQRPGHRCCWGYQSTDGMGLLEYLEWCEDLHMEPVLAVFAGYALRGEHVVGKELEPFVEEALDEIEYVTGDASTTWGRRRAVDGHPKPFPLRYVEIGNEDEFDRSRSYDSRFAQIYDAIKARYPQLQLIATTPVKSRRPDVVDDHYYHSARDMERDVHHYDKTDRNGPKIFVGEWASTEGRPTPTLNAALGDAAWMTGMERNSDVVVISCYAPLLVNVNRGASRWGTNLIGYDAQSCFGSPSYYVQKMFAENRGDTVLPVEIVPQARPVAEAPMPRGKVGVGTWLTEAEFKDIKVTSGDKLLYQADFSAGLRGWSTSRGRWTAGSGMLRQTSRLEDCRATAGNDRWTDYTYTLKARKTGGAEGFLIMFHVQDNDNFMWWNVGGWGNRRTALEAVRNGSKQELGPSSNVTVEPNRLYEVRIEVQGRSIRCYLDDKLITEATYERAMAAAPLFATASRVTAENAVVVKVVNVSPSAQQLEINLQGFSDVDKGATAEVISGDPADVNSVAEPKKVAPKHIAIKDASSRFVHELPQFSVSVLKIKGRFADSRTKQASK